jgi:hypothetical protein
MTGIDPKRTLRGLVCFRPSADASIVTEIRRSNRWKLRSDLGYQALSVPQFAPRIWMLLLDHLKSFLIRRRLNPMRRDDLISVT